jgi:AraC-like DNA-binding protein
MRDLRELRADAVLLSVARCQGTEPSRVAAVVREFPRSPAVALLSSHEPSAVRTLLTFGRSGIRTLVDVRTPVGWRDLREILRSEALAEIARLALARFAVDLAGVGDDCWLFFETLFRDGRDITTIRGLARRLRVQPSTLMSRFLRVGLPTPKRYLAYARLVRAAKLAENPGLSIAAIANHLEYSSPQGFGRHVRLVLRMSSGQFRQRYDGEGMLERFRTELIVPYRDHLAQVTPLKPGKRE